MNNFTLCTHDIIKLVLIMGTLALAVGAFTGIMVLVADHTKEVHDV